MFFQKNISLSVVKLILDYIVPISWSDSLPNWEIANQSELLNIQQKKKLKWPPVDTIILGKSKYATGVLLGEL